MMDETERDVDEMWPRREPAPRPEFTDDEEGFDKWLDHVIAGVSYHIPISIAMLEEIVGDLGSLDGPYRDPDEVVTEILIKLHVLPRD